MNPVIHFELPYKDATRASAFYASAFGWNTQDLGAEMGGYVMLTTATQDADPNGVRGAIPGGLFAIEDNAPISHPSVVIGVDDIQAAMTRITDAGGTVLGEAIQIPGIGHYVAFEDTEGNRNSILQGE